MKHPEVLLIPAILMLPKLLIALKERKAGERFFQLFVFDNEIYHSIQKENNKNWITPKSLIFFFIDTIFVIYLFEFSNLPEWFLSGLLGATLTLCAIILGIHTKYLFLINYLEKNRDAISGKITISEQFKVHYDLFDKLPILLPLITIAFFKPSPFILGACTGLFVFSLIIGYQILKKCKKSKFN